MSPRERSQLIDALIEGDLSEADFLRLEAELSIDPAARAEYYQRLALTASLEAEATAQPNFAPRLIPLRPATQGWIPQFAALAAALALVAVGWWGLRVWHPAGKKGTTSKAVAMLNRVVDAEWVSVSDGPKLSAPLEPGWLRLKSGLAQVVFYSGARVVIEGPAELELISPGEASCRKGRLTAEVPPQAHGFRVATPQTTVTDLGTSFGLNVKDDATEVHVFKGNVKVEAGATKTTQTLQAGAGFSFQNTQSPVPIAANAAAFASLFDLQSKSTMAESKRYDHWRAASDRLNQDPSLVVHFDFEKVPPSGWQIRNLGGRLSAGVSDGTIVGCQWAEGRWPGKKALEFQSVNDRVRLSVPGEFQALTLSAWVSVKGLDRKINSLLMSDGFEAGTVHWVIRQDGALGLTVIGSTPDNYQIAASPPLLAPDKFGLWIHLAVVLDPGAKRVVHYLNGSPISEKPLRIKPPFRIEAAELGNWNAKGFPENDPFMIRNFSGAMDEFCVFSRALNSEEILTLYSAGKPQPDPLVQNRN